MDGFSCMAYGALYALIGVLFHKRATVVAVSYTLLAEFLVSFVPAIINEFTIQIRLRTIYMNWMQERHLIRQMSSMLSEAPAIYQVLILFGVTSALLFAATTVMNYREYAHAEHET